MNEPPICPTCGSTSIDIQADNKTFKCKNCGEIAILPLQDRIMRKYFHFFPELEPLFKQGKSRNALAILLETILASFLLQNRMKRYARAISGFLFTLFGMALLPIGIWIITMMLLDEQSSGGLAKALLYLLLVSNFVIFTFFGKRIVDFIFRRLYSKEDIDEFMNWVNHRWGYSNLLKGLDPRVVCLYLYIITAASYLVAKFESFSGAILITQQWWVIYKEVLVEVLLTYVAIDAIFSKWSELAKDTKIGSVTMLPHSEQNM